MYNTEKTLIVVYKDEMLLNQLRKLVESNDDINSEKILGTKDKSINIVAWDEKVWLDNKKAGNIKDKVLFIDEIEGSDKLIPVIDVKFDDFGVKFGWAGNQAIIYADKNALNIRDEYLNFVSKLSDFPIPNELKAPINVKIKENFPKELEYSILKDENESNKSIPQILEIARKNVEKSVEVIGKVGNKLALITEDLLRDKKVVHKQMLFYGVSNMYINGLEEFMNA